MPSLNEVIDKSHVEENPNVVVATREVKYGLYKTLSLAQADTKLFDNADFTSTDTWKEKLLTPKWQETEGAFAYTEGDKIHVFAPTRWTSFTQKSVAQVLDITEEQVFILRRAKHPVQALLQAPVIILQSEIQHCTLSYRETPERRSRADVIGDLTHKEALAHLGGSDEKIHSPVEQTVYDGRPALIHGVKEFCHGNCFEVGWIRHPQDFKLHFLKTLDIYAVFSYTAVCTYLE